MPSRYETTGAFSPGTVPDTPELVLDTAIIAPNALSRRYHTREAGVTLAQNMAAIEDR